MHLSHRWFDCKMICFMAPLWWRYSLKMQSCVLWRSPSAGGSKLIWTDQQSCALLDVLGTTLGPETDFSPSISMMPKQSHSEMLRSRCWHIWWEHHLFLPVSLSAYLKQPHLQCSAVQPSLMAVRLWCTLGINSPRCGASFLCLCCSR